MNAAMPRLAALIAAIAAFAGTAHAACRDEAQGDARYIVCEFNPATDDIRLFLNDETDAPYGDFGPLAGALAAKGERLVFAMNAGMYHQDRSPVGLFIENGAEKKKISTRNGPGNFHLKPNGVFWIGKADAHVTDTEEFGAPPPSPASGRAGEILYATQSGPMLVIDGKIHPKFPVDATSRKRRNGVGVRKDGAVVIALSDTPVTFYEFATFFRDDLNTPDALYLDGAISRLYAPELNRNDPGVAMGPIVGVVEKAE
jgi:uncharacterized protein YigE (DUF2233 family)